MAAASAASRLSIRFSIVRRSLSPFGQPRVGKAQRAHHLFGRYAARGRPKGGLTRCALHRQRAGPAGGVLRGASLPYLDPLSSPCPMLIAIRRARRTLLTPCWQQAFDRKVGVKLTGFRLLLKEHRHDNADHHSDLRHQAICLANCSLAGAPAPSRQPLPRGGDRAPRASRRARSPAQARRPPAPGSRDDPLRDREQARRTGANTRANAAARLALTGGCGRLSVCRRQLRERWDEAIYAAPNARRNGLLRFARNDG